MISHPLNNYAAMLLAACLLLAFIMIKRDRAYALTCSAEFIASYLLVMCFPLFFDLTDWYSFPEYKAKFLFVYAIKDFIFICLLYRIYTPSKVLFMMGLLISMVFNWITLLVALRGYSVAYDIRPFVMVGCVALQLSAMVFTLVKGDDNDDNGITWRRKRTSSRVSYFSRMGHL